MKIFERMHFYQEIKFGMDVANLTQKNGMEKCGLRQKVALMDLVSIASAWVNCGRT